MKFDLHKVLLWSVPGEPLPAGILDVLGYWHWADKFARDHHELARCDDAILGSSDRRRPQKQKD